MKYSELFADKKPILAMIHLKGETRQDKLELAKKEIEIYYKNNIDAVIVEDYFGSKHDAEKVLEYLQKNLPDKIYGVNILNNFHRSFELAVLHGCKFIQVDSAAGHLPPISGEPVWYPPAGCRQSFQSTGSALFLIPKPSLISNGAGACGNLGIAYNEPSWMLFFPLSPVS